MKQFLKSFALTKGFYEYLKKSKYTKIRKKKLGGGYKLNCYSPNGSQKLCVILAGYKPFLYEVTFKRLKKFLDDDITVCVVSSGKWCDDLNALCKENCWDYLSVKRNNVALALNLAIYLHKDAKWIYKLDEDMFVTEGAFKSLFDTYQRVEKSGKYKVGFVAPLIPINGYGHMRILEKFNLVDKYTELFERPLYAAGPDRKIENDYNVAKFFWDGVYVPKLDKLNSILQSDEFAYSACPIRFSIGMILFNRTLWDDVMNGGFTVGKGSGMGGDEVEICNLAMSKSYAIIIDENNAVGHLSFGKQNEYMKQFFIQNKNLFDIGEN